MKTQASQTVVSVVLALIRNDDGDILWTLRHEGVHCGGLWELPGGKCETGESHEVALQRECREELGITIDHSEYLTSVTHEYPDRQVNLHLYAVLSYQGIPQPLASQGMQWLNHEQSRRLPIPEANACFWPYLLINKRLISHQSP